MQTTVDPEICIFPLHTVLFPDGILPLKVFEQRYIEMTKICLRDDRPFGVSRIREGHEVGAPAVPESVGSLATITQWEMPQAGIFHLVVRGGARFRILETQVAANGLISGRVELLPPEHGPAEVDRTCREVLQSIIDRFGVGGFPAPIRLDDPAWVAYRLAEVLPIDAITKQRLLELQDTAVRLAQVRRILQQQGLIQ